MTATAQPGLSGAVPDNPHYARRWWILAVLGVAQLMVVLDVTVVTIALPHAQQALHFSDGNRQWIITAYSLAFGGLLLIGGRIADHFGRKWTLIIGLVGFALASAFGGAAQNFGMFAAGRAIQGAFGALLAPSALSLLTTTFTDPKERGKAFGVYGGIGGGGASLGLLVGGLLTEYASWRWTMFVNLIFAAIALTGALLLLQHSRASERPRLDLPSTVIVTLGLFGIVYGFSHAETDGWGDGLTLLFLFAGAALVVIFAVLQTKLRNPLLPMRILADRNRGGAFLLMLIASAGMFGVFLFLTYFMEGLRGYSAVKTGLAFLPMTALLVIVAALSMTFLLTKISPRVLMPGGMFIAGVGMLLLTRLSLSGSYATHILLPTLVVGLGLGMCFPPGFNLAVLGVRPSDSGVASATVNTMQQIGGSIGTALFNTIAASVAASYVLAHAKSGLPQDLLAATAAVHSYSISFWIASAVYLGGAILGVLILRSGVVDMSGGDQPAGMH